MTENEKSALLPAGLRDVLPCDASLEADLVERIVTFFAQNGYERVKTPLIEFEDSLLSGAGVALAPQTFRLMDPVSQRMMAVRADITPQIARIARTRLGKTNRPLRLSYSGEVLRVRGTQLCPERQILQVGAELIGSELPSADTEIIFLATDAINSIGCDDFSVDLTVPRLVPSILEQFDLTENELAGIRVGLDRKDPEAIKVHAGQATETLSALFDATGSVDEALASLKDLSLPDSARAERDRLEEVVTLLQAEAPGLRLTLDPVENRGFEYHTGIGFTIFARGIAGELARGGRYRVRGDVSEDDERATGVTLYLDTILSMLPKSMESRRILLPRETSRSIKLDLQKDGWVTISSLDEDLNLCEQAKQLACSHFLGETGPELVKG